MVRKRTGLLLAAAVLALVPMPARTQTADGVQVVQRFVELMDAHRFDELESLLAEDLVFNMGPMTFERGPLVDYIREAYQAFPDFKHEIQDIFGAGDRVVARFINSGTHLGDLNGLAATGREVSFGVIAIYRVADGRIQEAWEESSSSR